MLSPSTFKAVRESGAVPGADYLLEVDGVRKEFPGVVALDDVSLRIRRGSVHALMGENGAGKSTLMKIIAGVYQPDAGTLRLKGNEIRIASPLDALEAGIAMIHQELNLMPFMTVAENIWIRREPVNRFGIIDHREMNRRTRALFDRIGIDVDPVSEVRDHSVATRQMIEIAKAVSYESDVLIMDEPTSALRVRWERGLKVRLGQIMVYFVTDRIFRERVDVEQREPEKARSSSSKISERSEQRRVAAPGAYAACGQGYRSTSRAFSP